GQETNGRADIYSLGATLYFLLAGRGPFADGQDTQKLALPTTQLPQPIQQVRPEVPDGLAAVLRRMLARDPAGRYQSAAEAVETLAAWHRAPKAPDPGPPQATAAADSACRDTGSSIDLPPPVALGPITPVELPVEQPAAPRQGNAGPAPT